MTVPLTLPNIPAVIRTDGRHFQNLPDYNFAPNYVCLHNPCGDNKLQMHYVDEGPHSAPVMLLLHGEPTWSYLYRKMIPVFADAGFRVIALDLIGFGRSDKLTFAPYYSFEQHIEWVRELVTTLDLQDITLVCQDWGGPIGLAVLAREENRFSRVVAGNTMLHTAEPELEDRLTWAVHATGRHNSTVNNMLLDWLRFSQRAIHFEAGSTIPASTARGLSDAEIAAYNAPFPSEWHKAGMRQFPLLIPVTQNDPGAAINRHTWQALARFHRPFLTLFGDSDPATRGWETVFCERVPGAKAQPHQILQQAGHFWQEDCGTETARFIVDWIRSAPV